MSGFARPFLLLLCCTALACYGLAQNAPEAVNAYAMLDRNSVRYLGPGRDSAYDLSGTEAVIGLILPAQNGSANQAARLLAVAQHAVDEALAVAPLEDGRKIRLAVRKEGQRWGQTSSDLVALVQEERALALVTLFNGDTAHQAEQIANKLSIPVITLASDGSTTAANIPWIFRLGPSDKDQAEAISTAIAGKASNVLLISEKDHDGRAGKAELLRALTSRGMTNVTTLEFEPKGWNESVWREQLEKAAPEVVIVWSNPGLASRIADTVSAVAPHAKVILSRKAAQDLDLRAAMQNLSPRPTFDNSATAAPPLVLLTASEADRRDDSLQIAARGVEQAVETLVQAIRPAGRNRARVRDFLARNTQEAGMRFDAAGNALAQWKLVPAGEWVASEPQALTRAHLPQDNQE